MAVKEFWGSLSGSSKLGLIIGAIGVLSVVALGGYFAFRSDYQTVLTSASPEKLATVIREAERLKIPYRLTADGSEVSVPKADVGKLRVGLVSVSGGGVGAVGFELFNNTDFSTTEFTQKINYQRALQGELARTISSIEGVASARVHLVMPESGFLRRQSVRPTAAVTVAMESGSQLSASQVHGIQKLVAASVADIKLDDIAVLDHEGIALTQSNRTGLSDSAGRNQLDAKKEIDSYMEAKLKRVLMNIDPQGQYGVSVDATLTQDDVKVTTEDLLPVDSTGLGLKTSGVLVRERQTSKRDGIPAEASNGGAAGPAATTKEAEYKVGRRVEQIATAPGAIERVSVAVVAKMNAGQAGEQNVRSIIASAIGANEQRGDTISLILLAAPIPDGLSDMASQKQADQVVPSVGQHKNLAPQSSTSSSQVVSVIAWLLGFLVLLVLAWVAIRRNAGRDAVEPTQHELDAVVARVNAWLAQEDQDAKA